MVGWLTYFGAILLMIYFAVWLSAPRQWLFSLPLLVYAIAVIFIADGIRGAYGSSNVAYAVLSVSATIAACFFILVPLIYGIFRLCLLPFIRDSAARTRLSDRVYWFIAGLLVPSVLLHERLFARYPGAIVMLVLLATSALTVVAFMLLRGRASPRSIWLCLPGYALGVPIMLAASLYYGAEVLPAASALAQGAPFCIESGPAQVTSSFDMTPLTLISREHSEYHAELIVETKPKPQIYNWSWRTLSFSPVKPDMYSARSCAK